MCGRRRAMRRVRHQVDVVEAYLRASAVHRTCCSSRWRPWWLRYCKGLPYWHVQMSRSGSIGEDARSRRGDGLVEDVSEGRSECRSGRQRVRSGNVGRSSQAVVVFGSVCRGKEMPSQVASKSERQGFKTWPSIKDDSSKRTDDAVGGARQANGKAEEQKQDEALRKRVGKLSGRVGAVVRLG